MHNDGRASFCMCCCSMRMGVDMLGARVHAYTRSYVRVCMQCVCVCVMLHMQCVSICVCVMLHMECVCVCVCVLVVAPFVRVHVCMRAHVGACGRMCMRVGPPACACVMISVRAALAHVCVMICLRAFTRMRSRKCVCVCSLSMRVLCVCTHVGECHWECTAQANATGNALRRRLAMPRKCRACWQVAGECMRVRAVCGMRCAAMCRCPRKLACISNAYMRTCMHRHTMRMHMHTMRMRKRVCI